MTDFVIVRKDSLVADGEVRVTEREPKRTQEVESLARCVRNAEPSTPSGSENSR